MRLNCIIVRIHYYSFEFVAVTDSSRDPHSQKTHPKVEGRSYFTADSQSVSQYVLVSSTLVGLATRHYFLSECCGLVFVGRPLWREDGSAICSVITQWSKSRRTRTHILLSHLRLPQPGGPGSRIYIPQEQGGPVIPPGTGKPHPLVNKKASS
jgi:hypothetical protein